jgi:hypothetical protein
MKIRRFLFLVCTLAGSVAGLSSVSAQTPPTDTAPPVTASPDPNGKSGSAGSNDNSRKPEIAPVTVQTTFVREEDGFVVWKVAPSGPAKIDVWISGVARCEGFDGADCGTITAGGPASFKQGNGHADQHLLIFQGFAKQGASCEVTNSIEYSVDSAATRQTVNGTYKCSGASTMGWTLFALFAAGAAGVAWVVHRKAEWER